MKSTLERKTRSQNHKQSLLQLALCLVTLLACCTLASAQHWTTITMPFPGSAGTAILRTDGVPLVHAKPWPRVQASAVF